MSPPRQLPEGATCAQPARELEARIKHRRFRHDGNTCLRWQASNVVVRRGVNDSLLPMKDLTESPNKIDAIDALISAIGGWLRLDAAMPDYSVQVMG